MRISWVRNTSKLERGHFRLATNLGRRHLPSPPLPSPRHASLSRIVLVIKDGDVSHPTQYSTSTFSVPTSKASKRSDSVPPNLSYRLRRCFLSLSLSLLVLLCVTHVCARLNPHQRERLLACPPRAQRRLGRGGTGLCYRPQSRSRPHSPSGLWSPHSRRLSGRRPPRVHASGF